AGGMGSAGATSSATGSAYGMLLGSVIGGTGSAPPMRSGWPSVKRDTHSFTRGCDESRSVPLSATGVAGDAGGGGGGTRLTLGGTGSAWRGPPGAFGVAERGGAGACGRGGVAGALDAGGAGCGATGRACVPDGDVVAGRTGFGIEPDGRMRVSVTLAVSIAGACTAARRAAAMTARTCSGVTTPAFDAFARR